MQILSTGVNIILQTGFPEIFFVDDFRSSTKRKSIKLVDSNHIVKVCEIQKDGQMFIEGFCIRQTSVTAALYHVQFELDFQRNVCNCQYACVARCSNKCKHIYALLHYMKNCRSVSKTSFEQQWGKPSLLQLSKSIYSKGKQCGSLFPQKIKTDEDEGVHDFSIDDLRNINCAARKVLHVESRDREEVERRRALEAIEEMKRASEEQI
ncbi:hypothetical protein PV325_004025 [Microctonus aethiopoides]|nr:hypothetical protein PV325_004025 [Microctonus aethiopoides]